MEITMEQINNRYGIVVNDEEWDLLHRSVIFRMDTVKGLTGKEPDDLKKLAEDLMKIKGKGYLETNTNQVTEEEIQDRICKNCE
jgi:hypothetical protein|tara:strand:+ start:5023 stop:5274 length:252 start_codon:yes stop_codon:yes gene_type:complete